MTPGEVSDESYPHRTTGGPQRTPVARGTVAGPARPGHRPGHGRPHGPRGPQRRPGHDGLRPALWPAVRTVIRAVRLAHDGQVGMWECVLLTSGAAPLSAAGPLRWVRSLEGYRLVGSHVPLRTRPKRGGNPGWLPPPKTSASAPPAASAHPGRGCRASRQPRPGSSDPDATNDVRVALGHCLAGHALEGPARQLTLNSHPGRGTHNRSICRAPASSSVDRHRAQVGVMHRMSGCCARLDVRSP